MEIYFIRWLTSLNSHFLITWAPGAGWIVISKFHWHQFLFLLDPSMELGISELLSITFTTWLIFQATCLEDFKAFLVNQRSWWTILVISGSRCYWQAKGTNQLWCPWAHFGSKISWLLWYSFPWKVLLLIQGYNFKLISQEFKPTFYHRKEFPPSHLSIIFRYI